MNRQELQSLVKTVYMKWQLHDASLRAGALTFFVMMPLPSLALIAVEILALFYGQNNAIEQLIQQVTSIAGPNVAGIVGDLLRNAQSPFTTVLGSLVSVAFTITGALGAYSVLQKSIDVIWETKSPTRGLFKTIRKKTVPFVFIFVAGLFVTAWTAFSTLFFDLVVVMLEPIFGGLAPFLLRGLHLVLSIILGTILFAIVFKQLPEVKIKWSDVSIAAVLTSLVFTVLNYAFGLYLSIFSVTTLAGTAGTLMLLFLWIYLTNLFLLFGVQFAKTYAERLGSLSKRNEAKPEQGEQAESVNVKVKLDWTIKATETAA